MSKPASSPPVLPTAWQDVLDKVLNTLKQAEAEAGRREEALAVSIDRLDALPKPKTAAIPRAGQENRENAGEAGMRAIERTCQELDEALGQSEAALNAWLEEAAAVQRNLANWGDREV